MLINNTMRFGSDVFGVQSGGASAPVYVVTKDALLIAKQPIDCSSVSYVDGFTFAGNQPANTNRRIIFKIDDNLYTLDNSAQLVPFSYQATLANVLLFGNTVNELAALNSVQAFVGKEIYPIIALSAPEDSDLPKIKIGIKTRTVEDTLSKRIYSAKYDLGDNAKIVDINFAATCSGQGNVTVRCRLYNGSWGSWIELNEANNLPASKIQFVIRLNVVNIGDDSAQLDSITVTHTTGNGSVNGDVTEIFSILNNFEVPLQTAYLVVRHKRLIDSTITADVAFLPTPKHKDLVSLGVATGTRESFQLPDSQIDHTTLQIFINGEQTDDFDFDLIDSVNEVTLNAPRDAAIAASYDYDCGSEIWQPMTRQSAQQPYGDGSYMSRFSLSTTLSDFSKAVVRITLNKPAGHISHKSLGTATGYLQQFALPHRMSSIVVTKPAQFSYDPNSQILSVVAPAGLSIAYAGKWQGESHIIYSFAAGFAL